MKCINCSNDCIRTSYSSVEGWSCEHCSKKSKQNRLPYVIMKGEGWTKSAKSKGTVNFRSL